MPVRVLPSAREARPSVSTASKRKIRDRVSIWSAENIMYTFRFYAASHGIYHLQALSRAADQIPMFVTEFGTQDYAGEGPNDLVQPQKYLNLMKTKKISWVNWNYSDDIRSGAVFNEGACDAGIVAGTSQLKEAGA